MNAVFEPVATSLGASVDQLKVIVCLLLSYPLAEIFTRLDASNPNSKHIYNLAISSLFLLGFLELWTGVLHLLGSVLATYFICANFKGSSMPWLVFTVVMGHLTINHLYRAFFEISLDTFEITGPQMVLTMKLSTFAWNVYDGRQPAESLDKWQSEKRVVKMPSLLAFLGYSFYFPGMLVGPYLEYANYAALIDRSAYATEKGKEKASAAGRLPPGRKRAGYWCMIQGLAFLGAFVLYGGKFTFPVVLTDWWLTKGFFYRIGYTQLIGFFERTKYYAIWKLTEGASIISGLGFTGYSADGKPSWHGAANVNIRVIEFPSNFKVLLDSWNMKTNVWLRECVYKRVTPKGKKPGFRSTLITFSTSAFWHGIASGYYMTFVLGAFIQTVQRLVRSTVRPLFLPAVSIIPIELHGPPGTSKPKPAPEGPPSFVKRIYDLVGTLASIIILNYAVVPFILLDFWPSIEAWNRLYWHGHIGLGLLLLFFYGGGAGYLKGIQKARVKKAEKVYNVDTNGQNVVIANGRTPMPMTPGSHVVPPVDLLAQKVEKGGLN
ncbi:MBOAT-domain-containing protein [Sistotremastrum suecicum HHB10207 ss-3]|uniref:MBOAT-domain-containing protein n=1 Tax=Sistotremastrum suecicum HHB10207 ss-3 TaxID=1314776 RepID=A0A166HSR6_9AGAM|nr:MBOAT-domain-containing protein [Sistotremastrum suecicum HHB10207 ss-3]